MKTIILAIAAMLVIPALPAAAATASTSSSQAKVWATDLPAFLNERLGEWIVGNSADPALSAAEAESSARRDAAAPLFDKLRSRLPRSSWPALRKRVESALASDDWVVDRQIKSDVRPYGTIWSASVLIEASPQRRDRLVRDVERETRQQHERVAGATAVATVIAMIVGSGYLMLNWLTRGYFRGRLLAASVLILMTGIFGIMHLL